MRILPVRFRREKGMGMSDSRKLVLIDGHSILNRAFYGVPDLSNAQGLHTNAIYGFLNIMFKILEEEKPDYLAVAFDVHAPTFRHQMYEAYKGTRKPMPEELREQVPVMKDVLRAMGIVIVEQAGLEADDILGTLAKKAQGEGIEVSLVSGDRDLLQIADEHIKIRIPKTQKGKTEIRDYYPRDVMDEYQVTPLQFIDLKALMGDTADNIPGVPKVGQKTATELMVAYGSLDNIYTHVEEISKKSIRESLIENKELADLSRTLATIKIDCDVELDYGAAKAEDFYTQEAYNLFKQLEFKNMLGRFEKDAVISHEEILKTFHRVEEQKEFLRRLEEIRDGSVVGFYLVQEKKQLLGVAVSICTEDKTDPVDNRKNAKHSSKRHEETLLCREETLFYPVTVAENEQLSLFEEPGSGEESDVAAVREAFQKLSGRVTLSGFDIKKQYDYLQQDNTDRYFDILIAAYLLNPLKNDYDPETIASEHLGLLIPGRAETFGKTPAKEAVRTMPQKAAEYYCYVAYVAAKAYSVLEEKLREAGMDRLMREMEMPLSLVLYDMEKEGVEVRREELKAYGDALIARIEELEQSIHSQAGMEFNINSPKQLGEVLFETMHIPGGKKTKTGYSTAADVLEKLSDDHPIVKDILEYRGLTKLKSTYADGLAVFIGEDDRIHTN